MLQSEDTATLERTLRGLQVDMMGTEHAPTLTRLQKAVREVESELRRRQLTGRA